MKLSSALAVLPLLLAAAPGESGGGAVRHMVFHAPSREIWFGTDTNTIGRIKVP